MSDIGVRAKRNLGFGAEQWWDLMVLYDRRRNDMRILEKKNFAGKPF